MSRRLQKRRRHPLRWSRRAVRLVIAVAAERMPKPMVNQIETRIWSMRLLWSGGGKSWSGRRPSADSGRQSSCRSRKRRQ